MKGLWLLALSGALAITTTGLVPGQAITPQASAAGKASNSAPPRKTTRGKPREVRFRSTQQAAKNVPATKQAASSDKKTQRQSSGQSAKAAVPSTSAAPVAASTPKRARRKTGSGKRVSTTAVAGVPMSSAAPTTAAAGPSGRASLNVNQSATSPRPARSRKVSRGSNARSARNGTKKRSRTTRGRSVKSAVRTPGTANNAKPTLSATPQAPANARASGVSSASSVLTRQGTAGGAVQQTTPQRQQGRFSRFVGRIRSALGWK